MAGTKNVETVFPLTPMQQGLLVHSLPATVGDAGLLHLRCDLEGPLDADRFGAAWAQAARRHPALRTVLRWEGLDAPVQIVLREVPLDLAVEDLSPLRPVDRQKRIEAAVADDRAQGLDLTRPPTMRLRVFRAAPEAAHLVWTCHHVLLDGWSSARVLGDVVAFYNAAHTGTAPDLPLAAPFRDYVRWLRAQPTDAAEAFWSAYLGGRSAPTPLPFEAPVTAAEAAGGYVSDAERQDAELPAQASEALRAVARRLGVTLGTVLQGAWAMVLGRATGHDDVVFDVTASGRSADVPGIEAMAGMLINALPVRARVDPEASAADVIRALHAAQADRVAHAHSAPAEVHAWSAMPAHQRISESLLVVENYPHADEGGGPLRFRGLGSGVTSSYPLTVIATPGAAIGLHLLSDGRRFAPSAMTQLLYRFEHLLADLAADPDRAVRDLLPEAGSAPAAAPEAEVPSTERDLDAAYVAPRGAVERQVVALWEEVLGVRPVGADDGFFDLGGQSVQVVRLLSAVERTFGETLPMSLLLGDGTPAAMAAALGTAAPASGAVLVPLAPEGSRAPLFCVHSYDGEALPYLRLAQLLGEDQPVYGLQAVGIDGDGELLTDVRAMAARYVEEIRAVQPEGPYALAAICFGVSVALEMARRLTEAGEEVSHLLAFDSSFNTLIEGRRPPADGSEAPRAAPTGSRPVRILKRLARRETLRELPLHIAVQARRARATVHKAAERRRWARAGTRELREWEAMETHLKAWDAYRPTPYPGPVTLLRSSAWSSWDDKWWHVPVWTELAEGGVEVHTVPGNHETMLHEPYVQALADQVRACLDGAPEAATDRPEAA
ncbi:MAG: condensation domain-containing protein [Bacteroidota bacterium]